MAFTSLCLPNLASLSPNILKPGLTCSKIHHSSRSTVKFFSPQKSCKIHAAISNVATAVNGKDLHQLVKGDLKLPEGLEDDKMPKHIGIITDGNRRWAVDRGWTPVAGHNAGRMALKSFLRHCCEFQIKAVTVFLFSAENWNRPTVEVESLMGIFADILREDVEELFRLGSRVNVIGDRSRLSKTLQQLSTQVEEKSKANSGTHVNYALNYSGKDDITQACKSIATKVKNGVVLPNQINESIFEHELSTKFWEFPCLDLLIRTSGEIRVSNFMLWQLANSELYFVKKYFPDFEENDLIDALRVFQKRCEHQGYDGCTRLMEYA